MTYGKRYEMATGWVERHIAQDLMLMYGKDELVSAEDDKTLEIAEYSDKNQVHFHVAAAVIRNAERNGHVARPFREILNILAKA